MINVLYLHSQFSLHFIDKMESNVKTLDCAAICVDI